ncbi:hypothetical protein LOD99_6671 [Oopsacas minuta]|uniref:FLYWCH-type domain-containing protein n=1 Tax=Oopsacas minuta TaxID=111878 RepID=A0AAV7JL45_9METZ|nr:hypothetical protein LOD99_6671 [Oopsacas minuta]
MATPNVVIEILKSSRGKEKVYIDGYLYTLTKSCYPYLYWLCEKRATCKARVSTEEGVVIKPESRSVIYSSNTHGPNPVRGEMIKGISQMKERALNSETNTRSILASGLGSMNESTIAALPKFDSIKRTIRRTRSSGENFDNSATATEIIIPKNYKVTSKGQQFLLYDSGIHETNRLLVFGTHQMLNLLRNTSNWYADGTFKKDGYIILCIYALMLNKLQSTYDELLKKLKEIEPEIDPSSIMVDFEKASINTLEENSLAVISACLFHLSQSIHRQIQSIGLATLYLEDEEFAIQMKMSVSLALVPEFEVIDCFTILMGNFPESGKEVAEYFEVNYIGKRREDQSRRIPRFPIRIWNMFTRVRSRLLRTNNSVER